MAAGELGDHQKLKKEIGLFGVFAITMGTTLGAGFFLLPGLAVVEGGPAMILAYLVVAIPLIPAMLSIVELATAMPRAGGAYYYLDRSMGPLVGTIGGIGIWMALVLKTSFALIGMGAYIALVAPWLPLVPLAAGLTVLFAAINLFGASHAGKLQAILVVILLLVLVFFSTAITEIEPVHFRGFFDKGWEAILATSGLVYVSYIGLIKPASVSEEIKDPEKNLPRGVFLAFFMAMILYAVGTTIMLGVTGPERLAGDLTPTATAAEIVFGPWGARLIAVAAICAFASVANAGILSASRYPLAMSRDHLLPPTLRALNEGGRPVPSILLTTGAILLFVVVFDPTKIAKLASAFQLVMISLLCFAVIVMRESRIDSYDPGFRSPLYPWMQIVGVVAPFVLLLEMGVLAIVFTFAIIGLGMWWYFYYGRPRIQRAGAIYHIFERLGRERYVALDVELRGIMKEKGLRDEDPFDDIVARGRILDLRTAADFEDVARQASVMLAERVEATPDHLLEGFLRGTRVGATPVSNGAALPHLRLPNMPAPELVIARVHSGLKLDVVDEFGESKPMDEPVHALFFLVSSEENPGQHLRILAQVAGRVDDESFIPEWLRAESEQDLKERLLRAERYVSMRLEPDGPTAPLVGLKLADCDLPQGCLIALIRRGDLTFVPFGSTQLRAGDRITVIGDPEAIREFSRVYN